MFGLHTAGTLILAAHFVPYSTTLYFSPTRLSVSFLPAFSGPHTGIREAPGTPLTSRFLHSVTCSLRHIALLSNVNELWRERGQAGDNYSVSGHQESCSSSPKAPDALPGSRRGGGHAISHRTSPSLRLK
ncbi:hypothetical protein E2C01_065220 [Portunus trituberculatus]|uniref:Uncharacterized protein n=1 Tax=Portunus trituberculatus TaxID=210409 RepID=A0A5B7HR47_PORTR|nr:hypothetical protein [Portunus trituberculatus]